eukprot:1094851-Prymnesium_polylepis.1
MPPSTRRRTSDGMSATREPEKAATPAASASTPEPTMFFARLITLAETDVPSGDGAAAARSAEARTLLSGPVAMPDREVVPRAKSGFEREAPSGTPGCSAVTATSSVSVQATSRIVLMFVRVGVLWEIGCAGVGDEGVVTEACNSS